jgi:TRAP-type C4-dicarboxylate transport system permease small subunit
MESYSTWEMVLAGLMGIGFIFWMKPGIKETLKKSDEAKSDWAGLLIPIGFVIMFVIFLIAMV